MKRMITLLLISCIFVSLMPVGLAAEGKVTLSFGGNGSATNIGYSCKVQVKSNQAPEHDLTVRIACKNREGYAEGILAAGEKTADITLPLSWLEEKATLTLVFAESEDYAIKNNSKLKLQVCEVPVVQLEKSPAFAFLGKKINYKVRVRNPATIAKDNNVFQLRNQNGLVLAEKEWKAGNKELTFGFEITEEMLGKNLVTVWLGDTCVSDREGYIAADDTSRPVVKKVNTQAPYMAVTLDCAYYPQQTDEILDVLDQNNVKATFFMTGYFMREFAEYAQRIEARGHEIGSHSNTHPRLTEKAPYDMLRQLQRPAEEIAALFGKETTLMRPPFGDVNKYVTALARAEGQEVIMWTIDSHDWDTAYNHDKVIKRVSKDITPGTIILFHLDGYWTPEVLAEMLPYYQEELGLKAVTVTELLSLEGAGPEVRLPGDENR